MIMQNKLGAIWRIFTVITVVCVVTGCPTTQPTDPTPGVTHQDWKNAARKLSDDMLASGRLDRQDDKKHVIAVGRFANNTSQHLQTDLLSEYIIQALDQTEKFRASALDDRLADQLRQLGNSPDVRPGSVFPGSSIEIPHYTINGKVFSERVQDGRNTVMSYNITVYIVNAVTKTRTVTLNYDFKKIVKGRHNRPY